MTMNMSEKRFGLHVQQLTRRPRNRLLREAGVTVTADGAGGASGGSAGAHMTVIDYAGLNEQRNESLTEIPTAYGLAKIKADVGIEEADEWEQSKAYRRGDVVRVGMTLYRFNLDMPAGVPWTPSYSKRLTLVDAAQPLTIGQSIIDSLD